MDVFNRDGILHISLMGGQARAILIESTQLVERAKATHNLSRIATAALGRTLTCAAMMGSMLKGKGESVTASIRGGGPIGTVLAVADSDCDLDWFSICNAGKSDSCAPSVLRQATRGRAENTIGRRRWFCSSFSAFFASSVGS